MLVWPYSCYGNMVMFYGDCYLGNSCYNTTDAATEVIIAMVTADAFCMDYILLYVSNRFQNLLIMQAN